MKMFEGKKGVVMGVVNDHSIGWGISALLHREGADLGFSHLPDKEGRDRMERRVRKLTDPLGVKLVYPCDVTRDDDIRGFFGAVRETFGTIDFFVHSIAFAPIDDIRCPTISCSRGGFLNAMDISVYSFLATAKAASEVMNPGGSILTMSYFGGERVVAGYNMMGLCKAALECAVRYAAYDLGPRGIRVNALSAGPVRTLAASAVGDFDNMMTLYAAASPLGRNITMDEVANSAAYLLGPMSTATTGEVHHVDSGYNIMGSPGRAVEKFRNG
jgi:enoyl-[acyl-carrier protein] reductase I